MNENKNKLLFYLESCIVIFVLCMKYNEYDAHLYVIRQKYLKL